MRQNILIISMILLFSACANNPKPAEQSKIKIVDEKPIAYAYMKDGTKLDYISTVYKAHSSDFEVIQINRHGFYPDYDLSEEELNGADIECSLANWKNKQKGMEKICNSEYTTHSSKQILETTGLNLLGLVLGGSKIPNIKSFDKNYFKKIIRDNNLVAEQQKLLSDKPRP